MNSTTKPAFLFSLPRSGSTLLQRILAKHPDIDTSAEPWLLLPLFSMLRTDGIYTNYDQNAVVGAIKDFYTTMPGGKADFMKEMGAYATNLYRKKARPGASYFLDKTPRYHLIANEILHSFPDAKCIFLWRNPLAIIASMLDTWHRGHWYLYFFKIDLYTGLLNLIETSQEFKDRVLVINYEALLSAPESVCKELCMYLEIPFHQEMIDDFQSVELKGEMGDPTGIKNYSSLSSKPLDKWKASLRNPVRKAWCKTYLNWLGKERLDIMGYSYDTLLKELKSTPFSVQHLAGDISRMTYGLFYQLFEFRMIQDKARALPSLKHIYPHL